MSLRRKRLLKRKENKRVIQRGERKCQLGGEGQGFNEYVEVGKNRFTIVIQKKNITTNK